MLGIERRQLIMDKIKQDKKVYVSELSQLFRVTEETVRRDLEKLEGDNLLRRSYGGAVLNEQKASEDLSFLKRSTINSETKEYIAQKAQNLISDGDTIMVDSSTTCLALLHHLQNHQDITIITNSIRLAYDFSTSPFRIISTGGSLRANSMALTGSATCTALERYYADIALISCKGIHEQLGVMESNEEESVVKQVMLAQAKKSLLLIDSSKFDKTAFVKTCELSAIDTLVTDKRPEDSWLETLNQKQVELIY
ncbi:DeoR/GlpR family DNA-binding transcription regulator [Selenomonas ruminantium]|uniref:Transcriptional regulator, DeoR family n=1 Tax=Selenomonas ruminantium TaxID=971 RepID=A0A1H3VX26_SELRU|nr:DeoR/GlpR family DNA-binding transcription regulator [Selenomonas ruminantium]SDZ78764.1 transcriptional regulator, DeoR family [Selenomonas ruminantium]